MFLRYKPILATFSFRVLDEFQFQMPMTIILCSPNPAIYLMHTRYVFIVIVCVVYTFLMQ